MTFAPKTILDARDYIKAKTGLDYASLGIVGDSAHRGGYHCGKDRLVSGDYSVYESSRDKNGLSYAASALDIGTFSKNGKTLRSLSLWLVDQCKAGAADTKDIREIIYTPDGNSVKRWDRLGERSSGDSSHLYHTHISFHRDSEFKDKTALFRRFWEGGSAISIDGGDDMIGLKKGDGPNEEVKGLQSILKRAGFDPGIVDGVYGDGTAGAVLAARKSRGSSATDGNNITGAAYEQIVVALILKLSEHTHSVPEATPVANFDLPVYGDSGVEVGYYQRLLRDLGEDAWISNKFDDNMVAALLSWWGKTFPGESYNGRAITSSVKLELERGVYKGEKGDPGEPGPAGADGKDATITGTVTVNVETGEVTS